MSDVQVSPTLGLRHWAALVRFFGVRQFAVGNLARMYPAMAAPIWPPAMAGSLSARIAPGQKSAGDDR